MENAINVAHYISELLFRHDCVTVPGFGAFVCTYAPARIHPAQHTFTPPGKQIVFNKHLQQNDGLLAQNIASEHGCSFDEAMSGIQAFAHTIQSQLKAGKKAELHNIGTLSLDPEGNIVFESYPEINYLIDSFGLASFQSMPVLREPAVEKRKPVEKIDRPLAEERPETIPVKPVTGRRIRRVLVTAAIAVPLLVAGFWFTAQNTDGLAGFGLFGKKESPHYQPIKWLRAGDAEKIPEPLHANSEGIAYLKLADNAPPVIVDIHKPEIDCTMVAKRVNSKSVYTPSKKTGNKFFIIAGAFSVPENAERFRRQLEEKGYDARLLDQVRSQLMHIGLASFDSKEDAEAFLRQVRADVPEAWILKK